jgi:hypothetical protein
MIFSHNQRGQLSLELLIFSAVTVILMGGFVLWAGSFLNLSVRDFNKNLAFSIAEGGIEYYRWHLAHAPTDYQDGTGGPGPYVHNYYSKDGDFLGSFTLEITPPPAGSSIVKIRSTGRVAADSGIQKIIEVRMGIPSFAKYAWAEGSSDSFGTNAEVFGPIRVNGGVHFDGIAHNLVESSFTSYNHNGEAPSGNEWGVHTNRGADDPAYPTPLPQRSDVFMGGRQVGVADLDFDIMAQDLAGIKTAASSSGTYFASSGAKGYDLVFATSGLFSVFKVTATSSRGSCNYERWTVQTETLFVTGTIPNNGNMFFEDNLWVRGRINGKRVTVGAAKFPDNPSDRRNITINNDLLYSQYSCSETIALIAQNNINIGYSSENDLRIDAALVAQNGSIGRDAYSTGSCGASSTRSQLTMYGTFVNKLIRGLSTYNNRTYIYDSNLLYCPPPSFPMVTDQYSLISWDEVK